MNRITLTGRVGGDPEVKHLQSGSVVATFSFATSERWKTKDGEKKESTQWHRCECWEGLAKVAEQYITKGKELAIEGKLMYDQWEDDKGKHTMAKIRVTGLEMMGGSGLQNATPSNGSIRQEEAVTEEGPSIPTSVPAGDEETDDLPF